MAGKLKSLDTGFSISVDNMDQERWNEALMEFGDSNFYQTWSYAARRWGVENTTHIALFRDGKVVALAMGRKVSFGILPGGVIHVRWGPVWMRSGEETDVSILSNMLRAMRNEYACRRRYLLNVLPKEVEEQHAHLKEIYEEEGFDFRESSERTFTVDLKPPLDDVMVNLRSSWRKSLRKASREGLEVFSSDLPQHKEWVVKIVREMEARKKYATFVDVAEMMKISDGLPESMKLDIHFCSHQDELVACLGWWRAGRTGIPLVGGTGDKALQLNASYLLWWKMVEYYHERGFLYCDLAGTNPETNPGVHHFKKGLAGKEADSTRYIGRFTACENLVSKALYLVASRLRGMYKRAKSVLGRAR